MTDRYGYYKRQWLLMLPAPEYTYDWSEHPEEWDGPCCCGTCRFKHANTAMGPEPDISYSMGPANGP